MVQNKLKMIKNVLYVYILCNNMGELPLYSIQLILTEFFLLN